MEKVRLNEINDQLKDYINESKFVSNKCRNKVIRMLSDSFKISISSSDYVPFDNVFIEILENGQVRLRNNIYGNPISDETVEAYYNDFKDKVDRFLSKKDLSFENLNTFGNIINLLFIVGICLILLIFTYIAIKAILEGDLSFALWFLVFIVPSSVPKLREMLEERFFQAKVFVRRLMKKINKK